MHVFLPSLYVWVMKTPHATHSAVALLTWSGSHTKWARFMHRLSWHRGLTWNPSVSCKIFFSRQNNTCPGLFGQSLNLTAYFKPSHIWGYPSLVTPLSRIWHWLISMDEFFLLSYPEEIRLKVKMPGRHCTVAKLQTNTQSDNGCDTESCYRGFWVDLTSMMLLKWLADKYAFDNELNDNVELERHWHIVHEPRISHWCQKLHANRNNI